ncbi:hypothetical protein ACK9YZ_30915 [Rhizobium sp. ZK1]
MSYICVPARFGLFNVVDRNTGLPPDIDVTAVFLTRNEARHLIAALEGDVRPAPNVSQSSVPDPFAKDCVCT